MTPHAIARTKSSLQIIIANTQTEIEIEQTADELLSADYPDDYEPDVDRMIRLQQTLNAATSALNSIGGIE